MFYSHEVLTSRKYGVATVWLVATLGQKSSARKISRKAILEVDVTKACETITTPEAPMALRLQSSLLYGVSRVYAQQAGYILTDAQHAQNAMRSLMKVVRAAELDPEAGKARPDQLVLQDDPGFDPTIPFGSLDSDLLDIDGHVPQRYISDSASLRTPINSQHASSQLAGGLQLPSSQSSGLGGGFMLPGEESGSRGPRPSSQFAREEEDFLLPEIDIGLDADGNFIEFDNVPQGGGVGVPSGRPSHASSRGHGQNEYAGGQQARGIPGAQFDEGDLPMIDVGYNLPPPKLGLSDGFRPQLERSDSMVDTSSTAAAPARRKTRIPKVLAIDSNIELRNRDLLAMNTGYLSNMAEDWKRITTAKTTTQAKKNAEYWVLGRGIGGVGGGLGRSGIKGPLAEMWSGDALYFWVTGRERHGETKGKKRESEDDGTEEERRVRPRLGDDQFAAGGLQGGDDTMMQDYNDLEVGREAQAPLEDISSAMPWNISASIRGSSLTRGAAGSAAGSLTRRGSRMVSASPLVGRDRSAPFEAMPDVGGLTSDPFMGDDLGGLVGEEDFELYGPGAAVDTQTAAQSQWQKAILDRESNNFFEFIGAAIEEKQAAGDDRDADVSIEFSELLSPENNSRTVAAQALLHVLTLGTKNLIRAHQAEPFAAIELRAL